ncbi:MAG: glycosyltransferase family 39 protein [Candidatus Aminicenantes bacterium]|nr:glycosyltransferase family 39 protein [Candidatus Aminicenantes bacterium]
MGHAPRFFILVFILAAFLLRIPLLQERYFDPDEFQHLHSARQLYNGEIPYRDYFDHHTPFMHFILAGLYPIAGENITVLFAARALMLLFTASILFLTFMATKKLYGADAGLFAALILSYTLMFLEKTLEIRPDLGAATFWLASIYFMANGIREKSSWRWYLFSGLSMGIAIMFSQKTLFGLPGIFLALAYLFCHRRGRIEWKQNIIVFPVFIAGLAIPVILTCLFFLAQDGLRQFIQCNFLMNVQWKMKLSPLKYLKQLAGQNPLLLIMGVAGLLVNISNMRRRADVEKGLFVPIFCTVSVVAGLFIIPAPQRQYYLLFLPLLAMYFAYIIIKCIESAAFTFIFKKPVYAVTLLAIILIAHPLYLVVTRHPQKNHRQLADIRYIMAATKPSEAVLDGFSGYGFLRPHAYYYYFLHKEMRAMLSEKELSDDIIKSAAGQNTKVVIYDRHLRALPLKVRQYIEANYAPGAIPSRGQKSAHQLHRFPRILFKKKKG